MGTSFDFLCARNAVVLLDCLSRIAREAKNGRGRQRFIAWDCLQRSACKQFPMESRKGKVTKVLRPGQEQGRVVWIVRSTPCSFVFEFFKPVGFEPLMAGFG